jgi:hypothetical protein
MYITVMDYNSGTITIYKVARGTNAEAWITENTSHQLDEIHWMTTDRYPTVIG